MAGKSKHWMPLALLLALATGAPGAQASEPPSGCASPTAALALFRVGSTGTFCVKAPCPWRGVAQADEQGGSSDGALLWAGDSPPAMAAKPADRERLLAAWQDFGCLLVEGRFVEGLLEVRRIVGAC